MTETRNWIPISVQDGPGPVGAYSPAALVGDLVFVSGQVPLDAESGEIRGAAPVEEQARLVLANLQRVVEAAGASLADVVQVTAYLADPGDWAAFNAVYQEFFTAPFPTRAVVGAALPGFRVEVTAVAVRPARSGA